jgi:hypothetical protein
VTLRVGTAGVTVRVGIGEGVGDVDVEDASTRAGVTVSVGEGIDTINEAAGSVDSKM